MSRAPQRGFVLIELLVALALTGLVTLLLLDGIRLASIGLDHISAQADQLDQRRGIAALLQRELGSALTLPGGVSAATLFVGEPTRLQFLTLAPDGEPDLYRVDLDFYPGRPDRPLVLTRRRADPLVPPDLRQSVLARRLRGFRLAYFGTDPATGKAAWYDRWDMEREPPRLVRVTIETAGGTVDPPIVIRLWAAPS